MSKIAVGRIIIVSATHIAIFARSRVAKNCNLSDPALQAFKITITIDISTVFESVLSEQ